MNEGATGTMVEDRADIPDPDKPNGYWEIIDPNLVNTLPEDPNNSSIVLKIRYGSTAFLFSGDAEAPAEQQILESGADISCKIIENGAHGFSKKHDAMAFRYLHSFAE
jgi:hypothetical protein